MPPRNYINPAPQTESAREAARSFFCDLCQKGYARQPELDAHIASYDHQHRKRLKDLNEASRDPGRTERQRRKENAEAGLVRLDFGSTRPAAEKKKAGFKPMGAKKVEDNQIKHTEMTSRPSKPGFKQIGTGEPMTEKSLFDRLPYEVYDPRKPTGLVG